MQKNICTVFNSDIFEKTERQNVAPNYDFYAKLIYDTYFWNIFL